MIRILVLPTVGLETEEEDSKLSGIPVEELNEFVEAAMEMREKAMDGRVMITIHGKDLRATMVTSPVSRRGIGNNKK